MFPASRPEEAVEERVQTLLSLETSRARRAWLRRHAPERDDALLQALQEEALHCERDDPHKAILVAHTMADAATVWGNEATRAAALYREAFACTLLDDHKSALRLYRRAAALYRALGLELEASRVAVGQVFTMMCLGLYREALALAEEAGHVFRAAGDLLSLGKMVMNQGSLFARLGRFEEARRCYLEAEEIFDALGEARHLAMVRANAANVLTELGEFRQAERLFRQARDQFEAEGLTSVTAQVDLNLAHHLYFARGDYQRALATAGRVRETYMALADSTGVAHVDQCRSDVYLALNLWQEALERAREARALFQAAGMAWDEARLWLNEGAALAHTNGRLPETEVPNPDEALERARAIFAREQNQVWLAMTDLYRAAFDRRSGALASARAAARRARETFLRSGLHSRAAQCDALLGEVALAEGDIPTAVRHFTGGLERLKDADMPAVAYLCLAGLGRAEQARGRTAAALRYYRQAVANVERLQIAIGAEDYKMAFMSDKQEVYQALILLALDQGTPEGMEEAFETVERAKSRALLDALARGPTTPAGSPAEAELRAEIERLKEELNWYYTRLYAPPAEDTRPTPERHAELLSAITSRERQLQELFKRWRAPDLILAPRNPVWTVTARQLRKALPEDALVLEFYTAGEQVIVFGLTREGMWVRRLPATCSEIVEALGQLRFQINKFGYGQEYRQRHMRALREGAHEALLHLHQALLSPLADVLTADTLVIVPHGPLHYVPFQALFDGCRYLLETRTVSYAPSATILYRLLISDATRDGRPPLMLGLSDPTIPYAEEEVRAVAALFPGAQVHLGAEATIASLMRNEERPAFLHLSTHATFRADNPLFSALKLADGWLSVSDVYGMAGSAPLVTLSACETGRNQVLVGDELVGLCRGFFAAGARSLVVSLWMVDDRSTARLMTRFYDELRAGRPADQALRSAQLETASQLDHPYYWAPFILTGDARTHLAS